MKERERNARVGELKAIISNVKNCHRIEVDDELLWHHLFRGGFSADCCLSYSWFGFLRRKQLAVVYKFFFFFLRWNVPPKLVVVQNGSLPRFSKQVNLLPTLLDFLFFILLVAQFTVCKVWKWKLRLSNRD